MDKAYERLSGWLQLCYHAVPAELCEGAAWLAADRTPVLVLRFPDPEENYKLLSAQDRKAFSPRELQQLDATRRSPFDNLLYILFREPDGQLRSKLIGGMGSRIFRIAHRFLQASGLPDGEGGHIC